MCLAGNYTWEDWPALKAANACYAMMVENCEEEKDLHRLDAQLAGNGVGQKNAPSLGGKKPAPIAPTESQHAKSKMQFLEQYGLAGKTGEEIDG